MKYIQNFVLRSLALLTLVVFFVFPNKTNANDWNAVENKSGLIIEMDNSYTDFLADGKVSLSWRSHVDSTKSYFVHKGSLNCSDFSLRTESIESFYVDDDNKQQNYRTIHINQSPSDRIEMFSLLEFPAYGGDWNKELRTLCIKRIENWSQLRELKFSELIEKRCAQNKRASNIYCGNNQNIREALVNMLTRRVQHRQACNSTEEEILVTESAIGEDECHEEKCRIELIDRASRLYGEDLIIQRFGKKCYAVNSNFNAIIADRKQKSEFSQYWSCARDNVKLLDDKTSSADILAQGVHSTCRGKISTEIYLSNELRQSLIQVILEERSSRRKH